MIGSEGAIGRGLPAEGSAAGGKERVHIDPLHQESVQWLGACQGMCPLDGWVAHKSTVTGHGSRLSEGGLAGEAQQRIPWCIGQADAIFTRGNCNADVSPSSPWANSPSGCTYRRTGAGTSSCVHRTLEQIYSPVHSSTTAAMGAGI